jgi:hypothetical protein
MPELLAPFILAAFGIDAAATAVTIAGVSISAGALVTAGLSIGLGILTIAIGLLLAPKPPTPENGEFAIQQALPPRSYGYGIVRFAGYVAFLENFNSSLFQVCAVFGHQCAGVINYYLNDDEVTVAAWPTYSLNGGQVLGLTDGRYQQAVTIDYRLGFSTESAYSAMVSTFPGIWGSDHRGDTVASTFMWAAGVPAQDFGKIYPYARPQLSLVWRTALIYDPRLPVPSPAAVTISIATPGVLTIGSAAPAAGTACVLSTTGVLPAFSASETYYVVNPSGDEFQLAISAGGPAIDTTGASQSGAHTALLGQTFGNPQSWPFSQNAALGILHFQCFNEFGPLLPYASAIAPVLAAWIAAADTCDEQVALKEGGTEPRYWLGGRSTTDQDPRSTLQTMLAACDGWFAQRGDGAIVLIVGYYADAPAQAVITDDDIVGFDVQTDLPDESKVNSITATWTSPSNGFTTVETDPLDDLADQELRGRKRQARLDLGWVQSNGQASRLLKREFIRQQAPLRGTLMLKLSAFNAFYERWIVVSSKTIPRLDGMVIENRKCVISISQPTTMDFIQVGPEVDAYDPATDESEPPTVPTRPTTVGLPIPANVVAVAEEVSSGGLTTIYLNISWDQPVDTITGAPRTDLSYVVQYQLSSGAAGWIQQTYQNSAVSIAASRCSVNTPPVPANTAIAVEAASTGVGAQTAFSTPVTTSTAAASVAPATPTSLVATGSSGHAALSCVAPNSINFVGGQFYRVATGGPFSSATAIGPEIYGAPNATLSYTDAVSPGTWDYFVTALNGAGTASSPAGPATATVT